MSKNLIDLLKLELTENTIFNVMEDIEQLESGAQKQILTYNFNLVDITVIKLETTVEIYSLFEYPSIPQILTIDEFKLELKKILSDMMLS